MFTKSGSIQRESVQLNTVSADHFFQCVKEEKEDDLRNYFGTQTTIMALKGRINVSNKNKNYHLHI